MTWHVRLSGMDESLTVEQSEVLAEAKVVQDRIAGRAVEQEQDLTLRTRIVDRAQELGLSQVRVARHIDVKPSMLGQAALRERRRAGATN